MEPNCGGVNGNATTRIPLLCLCARERDLPRCGRPSGQRFEHLDHWSWRCCDGGQGRYLVVTVRTVLAKTAGRAAWHSCQTFHFLLRLQVLFTFPPGSYTPGAAYMWYAFAINGAGGKSYASAAFSFIAPAT